MIGREKGRKREEQIYNGREYRRKGGRKEEREE